MVKNIVLQRRFFIFLIIFLPFYPLLRALLLTKNVWPSLLSTSSYIRDITIIIGFIIAATYRIVSNKKFTIKKSLMTFGVILFLLSSIYGFVISLIYGNFVLALKALHVTILPMIIYITILMSKGLGYSSFTKLYSVIIKLGLVLIFSGFFFYIYRPNFYVEIFNAFRPEYAGTLFPINYTRMVGIIFSPNVFGAFMAIISIIAFNWPIQKYNIRLIFWFSTIATILSLSRGSWIFLVSGLLTSVIFKRKKSLITVSKYFFVVILLMLITYNIFPKSWKIIEERGNTLFFFERGSAYERTETWKDALNIFMHRPFGCGLGVGGQINLGNEKTFKMFGIEVIDGYYLKIIVETGLMGILSFLIFLICSITQLVLSIKKTDHFIKMHHIVTTSILIGLCFQSVGSNPFDFIIISPFIWLFLGISNDIFTQTKHKELR